MTSLKDTRDFILLCYDQGILNDEELMVLYEQYKSPSLDLPYSSYPLFDLDDMEDDECLAEFRVKKRDIHALAEALQIPDWISCKTVSFHQGMSEFNTLTFNTCCKIVNLEPTNTKSKFLTVLQNLHHSSASAI